jgi:hypothetical protein
MNLVEKYAEEQGYKLAAMIDEKMGIVIKPRPKYCPEWLYKKIIRDSVEMVNIRE